MNKETNKADAGPSYSRDHIWVLESGANFTLGISDYAQAQLGEIIYVELPEIGDEFEQGEAFGVVESAKSVSELYMPMAGRVVGVNESVTDAPELLNQDALGRGWLMEITPIDANDRTELQALLTALEYQDLTA